MGKVLLDKIAIQESIHQNKVLNFRQVNEVDLVPLMVFYEDLFAKGQQIMIDSQLVNEKFYQDLINIFNRTNDIFNDKGIQTLYLAADLINHHLYLPDLPADDKDKDLVLCAPLLFYQVDFSYANENQINIEIDDKPIFNEKLVSYLCGTYNIDRPQGWQEWSIKQFKAWIYQTFNPILTFPNQQYRGLYLGSFDPFEKKLNLEIEQLAKANIDLYKAKPILDKQAYINQELNSEPLLVINNPLNFYQKLAIRSALNENTIIYGPPGTGKSEIIVNIIANGIANEKNMIVTCEKKTALDVLIERLGKVEQLCLFLNAIKDEDRVYQKINQIQELLGMTWINNPNDEFNYYQGSFHQFPLKQAIYDLNAIKTFSSRTSDFYQKIQTYVDLDFLAKSSLDFSSYQAEKDDLSSTFKNQEQFKILKQEARERFNDEKLVWDLILKIYYYDKFKKDYRITNDEQINNYFKQMEEFQLARLNSQFKKEIETSNLDFNHRFLKFNELMNTIDLVNDPEFADQLNKDYQLFEAIVINIMKLKSTYGHYFEDDAFVNFLITNRDLHQSFLDAIATTDRTMHMSITNHYLKRSQVKTNLNLEYIDDEAKVHFIKDAYEIIKMLMLHPLPKTIRFLFEINLKELALISAADVVFFYVNPTMKEEELTYLIAHDLIQVNQKLVDCVVKSELGTKIDRIKKLVEFEKINLQKKNFNDRTMNAYIDRFFNDNSNSILTISENIYRKYIEWIRQEWFLKDESFKKQAIEMFQVAKIPKNRMKITNFIKRYYDVLKALFPIWIGSPIDISNYCAFKENEFDMVVIDESSQMLMENALPALYRAKHAVVAGDDKQLKATVNFKKKYKSGEQIDFQSEIDFDIVESLLDRASVSLWNDFILRNHYRSEKQELIAFSNQHIYNNQLIFATKNHLSAPALEVFDVQGYYLDGVNKVEAQKAIELLDLAINSHNYQSYLIITFSVKQSEYILKLMTEAPNANLYNDLQLQNLLKVKNLENVQGFEADCVILSISHGRKGPDEKLKSAFGPLIQDGGINRLNVAITRSKSKMYVIKSLKANEMSLNRENRNLMTFYQYINYLDHLDEHYQSLIKVEKNKSLKINYGNEIIQYLVNKLKPLKYTCNHQLGNFVADIVFYGQDLNHIELIICLDYWSKYDEAKDFLESVNTQEFLKTIGYDFVRVKELEWLFNQKEVKAVLDEHVKKINQRLKKAIK